MEIKGRKKGESTRFEAGFFFPVGFPNEEKKKGEGKKNLRRGGGNRRKGLRPFRLAIN